MLNRFVIKPKDIVILLDHSTNMVEYNEIAVKIILNVFDKYILDKDMIGFVRFNLNTRIVFSLVQKEMYAN